MRSYGITNAAPYAAAPAVGLAGDTYFHTGLKQLYLSDGTQWIPYLTSNWNSAWGVVAQGTLTANSGNVGGTYTSIGLNATWTPVVGRRYKTSVDLLPVINQASTVFQCQIREFAGGTVVDGTSTTIAYAGYGDSLDFFTIVTPASAASITHMVYIACTTGTCYCYADATTPMRIVVEDVGPVTFAASGPGPDTPAYFHGSANTFAATPATWTDVTWAAPSSNVGFTFTANTRDIIVNQAGKYRASAALVGYSNATGGNAMNVQVIQYASNGSTVKAVRASQSDLQSPIGYWFQSLVETIFDCVAGDIIRVQGQPAAAIAWSAGASWVMIFPVGGTKGDPGIGIIPGGATNQVLAKKSGSDYDTQWLTTSSTAIPTGGATNQALVKKSATDYDTQWASAVGAWQAVSFSTGWTNYGGGWQTARYRLEEFGATVRLEGLVVHAAAIGGETTVAILPAGYRPPQHLLFSTIASNNVPQNDQYTRLDIQADGVILLRAFAGSSPPNSAYAIVYLSLNCSWSLT